MIYRLNFKKQRFSVVSLSMGFIRVLLALSVASIHWGLPVPIANIIPFNGNGSFPVSIFFIFSGFYMHLILKKGSLSKMEFYRSRFLRIYPSFFITIMILFWLYIASGTISFGEFEIDKKSANDLFVSLSLFQKFIVVLANFTTLGSDYLQFLNLRNLQLFPPAWTLSMEVIFYLLCPFLFKLTNKALFAIVAISLFLRLFTFLNGYDSYLWRHLFLPTELIFFVLGLLSYRLYEKLFLMNSIISSSNNHIVNLPNSFITMRVNDAVIKDTALSFNIWQKLMTFRIQQILGFVFFFVFILFWFFSLIPSSEIFLLIFSLLVVFATPFIFISFSNIKFDRFLGAFSYILYLSHFSAIKLSFLLINSSKISYILLVMISLLVYFIFENKFRKKISLIGGG